MPGPIRFLDIAYCKADLMQMSALHRRYFLMLGQLYNDIASMTVMLVQHYPSSFHDNDPKPIRARRTMGALLAIRQISARIWETHKLIDGEFGLFVRDMREEAPNAADHVKRVRKYLEGRNALKAIRHSVASHFDPETINKGIEAIPDDVIVSDFLTDSAGNCTFDAADTIMLYGLSVELQALWSDGVDRGPFEVLAKLTVEMRDAAIMVMDMAVSLQAGIYARYFPDKMESARQNVEIVRQQPLVDEVSAAVFIVGPADQERERAALFETRKARDVLRFSLQPLSPWQQHLDSIASNNASDRF